MLDEIVIVGRPGLVGGADTELFDQIKLWLKMGLKCRIIPTSEARYPINYEHPNLVIEEIRRYEACQGKHVLSYCNQYFLKDIETIRKYAKTLTWVSCMCFNFKEEIEAHRKGLIDFFLYQTKHQYDKCGVALLEANDNYNPIHIVPYFNSSSFPYHEHQDEPCYGRISRASLDKYARNQFQIYELACLRDIKGIVLGWSDELENTICSIVQDRMRKKGWVEFYKENEISAQEFYRRCSIICMATNTFENLPRIGLEAMASGTVLIVDNRGGWKTLVENGKTGYLCGSEGDFITHLENLVCRPDIRTKLALNARAKLDAEYSYEASASSWTKFFNRLT